MLSSKPMKLGRRLVLATLLSLSLAACQTTGTGGINAGAGSVSVACESFSDIKWSSKDTRETQEQAVEHNAVYDKLCGNKNRKN